MILGKFVAYTLHSWPKIR